MVRLKARDMQAELDAVFGDVGEAEPPRRVRLSRLSTYDRDRLRHDPGRESRDGTVRGWRASDLPETTKEALRRGGETSLSRRAASR